MRFRLLKIYLIVRNTFRINHWRGHGIHSPFMYGLTRNVLGKTKVVQGREIPPGLLPGHMLKRDRMLAENLWRHLGYENCLTGSEGEIKNRTLVVLAAGTPAAVLEALLEKIGENGTDECCVAVFGANKSREIYRLCRKTVKTGPCVSVDFYRTYLFFFDGRLQKQYYRIRSRYGDPLIDTFPGIR